MPFPAQGSQSEGSCSERSRVQLTFPGASLACVSSREVLAGENRTAVTLRRYRKGLQGDRFLLS